MNFFSFFLSSPSSLSIFCSLLKKSSPITFFIERECFVAPYLKGLSFQVLEPWKNREDRSKSDTICNSSAFMRCNQVDESQKIEILWREFFFSLHPFFLSSSLIFCSIRRAIRLIGWKLREYLSCKLIWLDFPSIKKKERKVSLSNLSGSKSQFALQESHIIITQWVTSLSSFFFFSFFLLEDEREKEWEQEEGRVCGSDSVPLISWEMKIKRTFIILVISLI